MPSIEDVLEPDEAAFLRLPGGGREADGTAFFPPNRSCRRWKGGRWGTSGGWGIRVEAGPCADVNPNKDAPGLREGQVPWGSGPALI